MINQNKRSLLQPPNDESSLTNLNIIDPKTVLNVQILANLEKKQGFKFSICLNKKGLLSIIFFNIIKRTRTNMNERNRTYYRT
ncbi:hypothetical protein HanHA89_Chr13g0535611 [Helianthus annuus]|nr:hypothetical protein HanHA89_Chr13g0535611 [Helianthus annuus]